jgi:hypothetical protein
VALLLTYVLMLKHLVLSTQMLTIAVGLVKSSQEQPRANDIKSKIRQDSASAFPVYADKILNGTSVDSIGSAYKSSLANILELDADSVDFNEPLLRKALQYTQDGKPAVMPVWMFEQELRQDSRWQYTNNARESVYNAIYQVGTDMGVI